MILLHAVELVSILLTALVLGVYWGPWIALSRTMSSLDASSFLAVTHRMDRNLAPVMTVLSPAALLSIAAVAVLSIGHPLQLVLAIGALVAVGATVIVSVAVEVPIVVKFRAWADVAAMPEGWQLLRDRWVSFHLARVTGGLLGLGLLAAAAIF